MTDQGKRAVKASVFSVLVLVALALPWLLRFRKDGAYWTHVLVLIAIMILATSSMRAINRTGELSLGTAGFMLLGGYGAALLSIKLGLSPWLTILLGALIAAFVAALVAYPFFRVKGVYFVICTLLLGFILLYLTAYFDEFTGGWQGIQFFKISPEIDTPWGTLVFTTGGDFPHIAYYYLTILVVGICLFVLYRMERSRIGLVWKSIREADSLAQSVGVNVMGQKVFIFVIACFFTGIAGGLYAFHVHALSPTSTPANWFHFFTSVYCLLYMVVGGVESFWGPLVGTTLIMLVREFAREAKEYWPLVIGFLLIFIVFFMPKGLMALNEYVPLWYKRLRDLSRRKTPTSS
jgi:branched-chain amino acid transport system permease protein